MFTGNLSLGIEVSHILNLLAGSGTISSMIPSRVGKNEGHKWHHRWKWWWEKCHMVVRGGKVTAVDGGEGLTKWNGKQWQEVTK